MKKKIIIRDDRFKAKAMLIIDALPVEPDKDIHQVMIRPYKTSRTEQQNALYWVWNAFIGDELGYTKDEMHDLNRERFGISIVAQQSERFASLLRLVELLQVDQERWAGMAALAQAVHTPRFLIDSMREYLERIDEWAISMGIALPIPKHLHLMRKDHYRERR